MVRGRIWRQYIDRVTHAQSGGEENVVDAVLSRHVDAIRADLGRIDTRPGVGVNAIDQLVGFLVVTQLVIAQCDHIGFIL